MLQALLCSPAGEELQESWEIRIWGRGQKENIFPKDLIILLSSSNQVLLLLAFLEEPTHPPLLNQSPTVCRGHPWGLRNPSSAPGSVPAP